MLKKSLSTYCLPRVITSYGLQKFGPQFHANLAPSKWQRFEGRPHVSQTNQCISPIPLEKNNNVKMAKYQPISIYLVTLLTSLVKTVGRSSVGKMTPTLLGGWLLFNFEPFKRASKALELPNQGDALVPLNKTFSPSSVTSAGKIVYKTR